MMSRRESGKTAVATTAGFFDISIFGSSAASGEVLAAYRIPARDAVFIRVRGHFARIWKGESWVVFGRSKNRSQKNRLQPVDEEVTGGLTPQSKGCGTVEAGSAGADLRRTPQDAKT